MAVGVRIAAVEVAWVATAGVGRLMPDAEGSSMGTYHQLIVGARPRRDSRPVPPNGRSWRHGSQLGRDGRRLYRRVRPVASWRIPISRGQASKPVFSRLVRAAASTASDSVDSRGNRPSRLANRVECPARWKKGVSDFLQRLALSQHWWATCTSPTQATPLVPDHACH